jgi:hypothetical protein
MTPAESEVFVIVGGRQVCPHEENHRLSLRGAVSYDCLNEVEVALSQARQDIETDSIIVPVVRSWLPLLAGDVSSPVTDLRS